jgi:TolB-like protein/Flp pilus assembly protein TadD
MPEREILDSWKEIAGYLGRDIRTCQHYERKLGLPVHRLDRSARARVFAYRDELDSWRARKKTPGLGVSKEITVKFIPKKLLIPALALILIVVIATILLMKGSFSRKTSASSAGKSIAVLPFENIGGAGEDEAFCNGITEDITTALSQISELDVRSSESATRYKPKDLGIKEIGRKLNASHVLIGSVRRVGGKVRITSRLIEAATDTNVWAENFDRDLNEIFAIQRDIAQQIAAALEATLAPAEKERIEKRPTKDVRAYEYYVRGRQYYLRYKKEENEQAIRLFKMAIELDPGYALAYAGLADSYFQRTNRFGLPEAEGYDPALEQAQIAISLDPDLGQGYKALGTIYGHGKGWWSKAIEASRRAIEADPNDYFLCTDLGTTYYVMGEYDKAFPFIKKAIALSPASAFPCFTLGSIYLGLDDPVQAEVWYRKALELQPDLDVANAGLVNLYLTYGEYDKAIEHGQAYLFKLPGYPEAYYYAALAELFAGHDEKAREYLQKIEVPKIKRVYVILPGYLLWKAGRKAEARELFQRNLDLLHKRIEQGDEGHTIRFYLAAIHAVQGNRQEAFEWLEKAAEAGWRDYHYAPRYPLFESIRDDARFKRIMDDNKARVAEMRRRVEQLERRSPKTAQLE